MMEQWNSGIMGSGMMQCWINGPATGGIDDKIKMVRIIKIVEQLPNTRAGSHVAGH